MKGQYTNVRDCKNGQYLDDTSENNTDWDCRVCPEGAKCCHQNGEDGRCDKVATFLELGAEETTGVCGGHTNYDNLHYFFVKCPIANAMQRNLWLHLH